MFSKSIHFLDRGTHSRAKLYILLKILQFRPLDFHPEVIEFQLLFSNPTYNSSANQPYSPKSPSV